MKATRLPEDWKLPEEWRNWALAERPDLNPDKVAEEFRDYWIAIPGKGGTKLNWQATWRNWVRRQKRGAEPPRRAPEIRHRRTTDAQWREARGIASKHLDKLKGLVK